MKQELTYLDVIFRSDNLRKVILLILKAITLILIIFLISGCSEKNYFGSVKNPKTPSIPKPEDLHYCEKDSDCTTSPFVENSCCFFCIGAVNIEGEKYLEEWHTINCGHLKYPYGCPIFECCGVDDVKCINNTCTAISECT